jgi:hypothetical protein
LIPVEFLSAMESRFEKNAHLYVDLYNVFVTEITEYRKNPTKFPKLFFIHI